MRTPIRICHVIEATTGGTRRHVVDLATHLDTSQFEVSIACSTRRDAGFLSDVAAMRERGIAVHEIDMVRSIHPPRDLRSVVALRRHFARHDYDLVHTHSSKAGIVGRYAARSAGVSTVIHTPHVFPFQMRRSALVGALYAGLERRAARRTDAIICVSAEERQAAVDHALCDADKLHVIPNGIDLSGMPDPAASEGLRAELAIDSACAVVGAVGRVSEQKGFDVLVHATRKLVDRGRSTVVLVVGDGPEREGLERLVRELDLESAFRFCGAREDVRRFYALMDVLAIPSRWEGLPYTLLEGMAAGRAVVASSIGGMREVLADSAAGILVPPDNQEQLAAALDHLLGNPDKRQELGRAAHQLVKERYQLGSMIAATSHLYERLVTGRTE